MVLSNQQAIDAATSLEKANRSEWARLNRYVRYARGKQKLPWLPDNAETEYRDIAEKSASNWLGLVIDAVAQGLFIDNYGDTTEDNGSLAWEEGWQANGMDARQVDLNRAILTLGYSYLFEFPSDDGVWMRPEAATKVAASYDDPGDEWPLQVLRVISKGRWELYDAEARYTILGEGPARKVTVAEHGQEYPPVVRLRSSLDLLGPPQGEVEKVIPIQDRIVDATFTLQMVAKYGAFPQRWIAGLDTAKPLTDDSGQPLLDGSGNPVFPTIKAYVDHILTAVDPDTKFGQFAAADLGQYVQVLEAHIRHLAAISQVPPHYLLGSLVNLSAEALAAAESGLQRKIEDKQVVLGEGYEQALRLSASILGDEEAAMDITSHVHWANTETQALALVSDAILKLSSIGVPMSVLLPMIPTLSKTDVDKALAEIESGSGMEALVQRLTPPASLPAA